MPYYRRVRFNEEINATRRYLYKGNLSSTITGVRPREVVDDVSFRTVVPEGDHVSVVDRRTMEPYSWFMDLQNLKAKAAVEGGFDATMFRDDRGHAWEFEKYTTEGTPWNFSWNNSVGDRYEHWGAYPLITAGSLSSGFHVPSSGLEAWAATQYGNIAPSVAEFSLSTFLGELREGLPRVLPSVLKPSVKRVRDAGSDYLNVEFGWKPLINDLQGMAQALLGASVGLYQPYGAFHRSRKSQPIVNFERAEGGSSAVPIGYSIGATGLPAKYHAMLENAGSTGQSQARGSVSVVRRSEIKRWMEGEFVYLPKADFDRKRYQDRLETLMSVDITPSVLWELSPWSWLVDWFTDIGGSIASMEAAVSNRVVSTYCYAMEQTETSVSTNAVIFGTSSSSVIYDGPRTLNHVWKYTRKRRVRANPFGYSGSPDATLNGSQMAILGSLGLTKLR